MLPEILLAGKQLEMSLQNNRTAELWSSFGPLIKTIPDRLDSFRYSLQEYPPHYFDQFNPTLPFIKWALVAVKNHTGIPDTSKKFTLPAGDYAVFHLTGNNTEIFQYIYFSWLPQSGFTLDNRPHFELLGANYKNGDPASEEDLYIPIKKK
ncbi:MAG: GyrI-like domain-containing protein [Bacteroidetes bacterium]|nr:GyrI-like domain-containing protein [Bacteroidota bacterium]